MVLIWTVGGVGGGQDDLDDYCSFLESHATGRECSSRQAGMHMLLHMEEHFWSDWWSTTVAYIGLQGTIIATYIQEVLILHKDM